MKAEELLKRYGAGERNFGGMDLREANLSRANLHHIDLSGADLSVANLSGANLSGADLRGARLNVAKLSGANLSGANLSGCILNVANLVRADLTGANLSQAALIRAELMRADLKQATLDSADLGGAQLQEAQLHQANFSRANLSEVSFHRAILADAVFDQANLRGADLNRANATRANFRNAELRLANLSEILLTSADLHGANLRWANLTGARMRGADLTEAKLSGAAIVGADLRNVNLTHASLIHADLSRANLIGADWIGAELTGATLTGAKLHGVSRYGLKVEDLTCEWVDLSPQGDNSQIHYLSQEDCRQFFNETLPTVQITVDAALDPDAAVSLAVIYRQIARRSPVMAHPPSIQVGARRTVILFQVGSNVQLFATAYSAILPFEDAAVTQTNLLEMVRSLQEGAVEGDRPVTPRPETFSAVLHQLAAQIDGVTILDNLPRLAQRGAFFQTPTQTMLINSSNQRLTVYHHPAFGKRFVSEADASPDPITPPLPVSPTQKAAPFLLPPLSVTADFVRHFHDL